jgi:hypothetical protein
MVIVADVGHVYLVARVENPVEGVSREYRFMIDTDASYMILREQEFRELKLKPIGTVKLTLADGRILEAPIAPRKSICYGQGGHGLRSTSRAANTPIRSLHTRSARISSRPQHKRGKTIKTSSTNTLANSKSRTLMKMAISKYANVLGSRLYIHISLTT